MSDELEIVWYDDPTKNDTEEHFVSDDKQSEAPKPEANASETKPAKRLEPAQG